MCPPGASIVVMSSWPSHCWKCTFMRNTAKSSTSVLFAQWPSSQQTAPRLTWPASTQESLTRRLSEYFVIICSFPLLGSSRAPPFHPFFLFFFVFCPHIRKIAATVCWQRFVPNNRVLSLIRMQSAWVGGEELGLLVLFTSVKGP